jgi:GntR family transcriptional regulator
MFEINPLSRTPVYAQIIEQVERFVLTGVFQPLDQVPSVRSLAVESGVNPNTIQKAYMQMERDKILQSAPGKGRFVTLEAASIISGRRREQLDGLKEQMQILAVAGIRREEIDACLDEVYGKAEGNKR